MTASSTGDRPSNPVSKEMRDCFQGNIDRYSGQTHYVDCWRDHWACALARTLDEIDRLTHELAMWIQVWDNVKLDNPNLREDNKPLAVAATYALLKARTPPEARESYLSGWLIEGAWSAVDRPEYWVGSSRWSTDSYKALRFATRKSAQQAADLMCAGMNVRIACHEFAEDEE